MAQVSLFAKSLHYGSGMVVQTAASGAISELQELYLVITGKDGILGFGEIRENIAYLNGYSPRQVRNSITKLCEILDWSRDPLDILAHLRSLNWPVTPAKALVDCVLHDWLARSHAQPLCFFMNGKEVAPSHTNQTLFLSNDKNLRETAARYISEGYASLKVRVGGSDFQRELDNIKYLRNMHGQSISIAIDANGAWSEDDAVSHLRDLADYDIEYAEQPVAAGDWAKIDRVSQSVSIPVFLDESVASTQDVDQILERNGRIGAHLKIVKMGGVGPLFEAGKTLCDAGVPVMIGQMNEGAAATAAAVHLAIALDAPHRELYGAMGLQDDPGTNLRYSDGYVHLPNKPGIGVELSTAGLELIWRNSE